MAVMAMTAKAALWASGQRAAAVMPALAAMAAMVLLVVLVAQAVLGVLAALPVQAATVVLAVWLVTAAQACFWKAATTSSGTMDSSGVVTVLSAEPAFI